MMIFCAQCGRELAPEARFCSSCGAPNAAMPVAAMPATLRLTRPRAGRMIAGVCQGLALNYGWDVVWVRLITVLIAVLSSGAGGIAYIIFWIVMPEQLLNLPSPSAYPAGTTPEGWKAPETWKAPEASKAPEA